MNTETLEYVEATGQALAQAEKLANDLLTEQAVIEAMAIKTAALCCNVGLIEAHEQKEVAEKLASHRGAIDAVEHLIADRQQTKAAAAKQAPAQQLAMTGGLQPVQAQKAARAPRSLTGSDYVGRRRGQGEKSAADLAMAESLGVPCN